MEGMIVFESKIGSDEAENENGYMALLVGMREVQEAKQREP
jgi:hypothetical protein